MEFPKEIERIYIDRTKYHEWNKYYRKLKLVYVPEHRRFGVYVDENGHKECFDPFDLGITVTEQRKMKTYTKN